MGRSGGLRRRDARKVLTKVLRPRVMLVLYQRDGFSATCKCSWQIASAFKPIGKTVPRVRRFWMLLYVEPKRRDGRLQKAGAQIVVSKVIHNCFRRARGAPHCSLNLAK